MPPNPVIALVGASGWLGRYIGPALLANGLTDAEHFHALNRSGPSNAYTAWPVAWHHDLAEAPSPDVVILSLRPDDFRAGNFHCPDALVISVMAGVLAAEIAEKTGASRIIRALPNALAEVGQSYTPWTAAAAAGEADKSLARAIFSGIGTEAEVPGEAQIDVMTALSGAGPAYAALLATALIKAAESQGLSPSLARGAAENLVCNAALLLKGRIAEAPDIVQSFIDYDGVIAEGLRTTRAAGHDESIAKGLEAALVKVRQMNLG
ncbi:pyrroline-5-carboxylate reductase family protein [Pseudooceanicola algae]|uniref:Pyrroline-5-carboxylate reductase n=1 Tax=Pseudooceanicola algae TaxID=1537215 RepID=A0A418SFU4_9RHOB|nr:pyrroline-5-carboxylate reductase dimerization domain-containing protein [Pseudooceanicola algae]QPM89175.1 Pyrroline-5-carboxylate reductase [Pseudooceanicola algae]